MSCDSKHSPTVVDTSPKYILEIPFFHARLLVQKFPDLAEAKAIAELLVRHEFFTGYAIGATGIACSHFAATLIDIEEQINAKLQQTVASGVYDRIAYFAGEISTGVMQSMPTALSKTASELGLGRFAVGQRMSDQELFDLNQVIHKGYGFILVRK